MMLMLMARDGDGDARASREYRTHYTSTDVVL